MNLEATALKMANPSVVHDTSYGKIVSLSLSPEYVDNIGRQWQVSNFTSDSR